MQPTTKTLRKISPTGGSILPDKNEIFRKPDEIKYFTSFTEHLCPVSYKFKVDDEK